MQSNASVISVSLDLNVTTVTVKSRFDSSRRDACTDEAISLRVTSVVMISLSSASNMVLITGGSEIGRVPSGGLCRSKPCTASKFGFAGTLNLRICPLGFAALAFITRRNPSSRMCGRWSVIMTTDQEQQILRRSEVLVSVNDEINNFLILSAEAS